jgi:uncharacterized protein (TIGR02118 family)
LSPPGKIGSDPITPGRKIASPPAAFEEYYATTHVPLVGKMPNVARFEATRVLGTPDGSGPPY